MNFESIFLQTALILAGSALLGGLLLKLRQPLIIAFIAVGILVGPSVLDVVSHSQQFHLLAEMGIALLLFAVGLKLDLHLIRTMGPVALATGLGQVLFTSVFGFLLALAISMPPVSALYVAFALTFSSTIIIVKLLSDKREIDALHGRIAVGFLIVQDIAVIFAMIGLTAIGAGRAGQHLWLGGLLVLLKGGVLLGGFGPGHALFAPPAGSHRPQQGVAAACRRGVGRPFRRRRRPLELQQGNRGLSGGSLPCLHHLSGGDRLAAGELARFPLAFLFHQPRRPARPLRLGGPSRAGSALLGLRPDRQPHHRDDHHGVHGLSPAHRLPGRTHRSPDQRVFLNFGRARGRPRPYRPGNPGLITLVGLLTISLSTYLILYSHQLYARVGPWLTLFERSHPYREVARDSAGEPERIDVLLFGLGRYGRNIAENLVRRGKKVLAVDFDPQVVSGPPDGIRVRYGDAEDPEMLEHLPLQRAGWVVNAIPGRDLNLSLLKSLRERGYRGRVVLTAHNLEEVRLYRQAGADKVLWPFADAAEQAVDALTASLDEISALAPWPFALEEVKIRADSAAPGKRLADLALRPRKGVSVVAVDRSGRSHFDPSSEFVIFPGDRLVLLGTEEGLRQARYLLEETEIPPAAENKFVIEEIPLHPGWGGTTLAALDLRHRFGVTVIGIRRGKEMIVSPLPDEELRAGDILVVIGQQDSLSHCRQGGNLSSCF